MEKPISAADANRKFSELLRHVRDGQSYVVTSHGKVVARIAPMNDGSRLSARARVTLLTRLRAERAIKIGRWTRAELYEDAP
jgi:prevent-host-death family protein